MDNIPSSYASILDQIRIAVEKANRQVKEIRLIGVSKTRSWQEIQPFLDAGLKDIGENYVQEAEEKFHFLRTPVFKHMIGHLQSNKVSDAVRIFDMIQTVDREKIISKVAQNAEKYKKNPFPILIQVNISQEESKSGCTVDDLWKFADILSSSEYKKNIDWQGIMSISPLNAITTESKLKFHKEAFSIFDEIKQSYSQCKELSLGMSNDFVEAIIAGATMIRIGTLLFGPRMYQ